LSLLPVFSRRHHLLLGLSVLLLLLNGGTTVSTAAAHHASDGFVSNGRACTESHAGCNGAAEAATPTKHTRTGRLLRRSLILLLSLLLVMHHWGS